jgi:hypothetical protein
MSKAKSSKTYSRKVAWQTNSFQESLVPVFTKLSLVNGRLDVSERYNLSVAIGDTHHLSSEVTGR